MFGLYVRAFVHACHVHHTAQVCTNVLTLMDEQVLAHNSYNMLSTFKSPTNSQLRRINNFVIFHQRKTWVFLKSMYPALWSGQKIILYMGSMQLCLGLYEQIFSFKIDVDDCIQAKQNLDSNAQHKIYIRQTIN